MQIAVDESALAQIAVEGDFHQPARGGDAGQLFAKLVCTLRPRRLRRWVGGFERSDFGLKPGDARFKARKPVGRDAMRQCAAEAFV